MLSRSPLIGNLIKMAEFLRILPRGFYEFNNVFLAGTVDKIVKAGVSFLLDNATMLIRYLEVGDPVRSGDSFIQENHMIHY